jgi:hypothetical protein
VLLSCGLLHPFFFYRYSHPVVYRCFLQVAYICILPVPIVVYLLFLIVAYFMCPYSFCSCIPRGLGSTLIKLVWTRQQLLYTSRVAGPALITRPYILIPTCPVYSPASPLFYTYSRILFSHPLFTNQFVIRSRDLYPLLRKERREGALLGDPLFLSHPR